MTESRLNIRISPEKKDAFYQKVKQDGKNATDVLIDLIDQYLGNKVESGEILELKQRVEKLEEVVLGEIAA
jgi:maltose-binding protein MalE